MLLDLISCPQVHLPNLILRLILAKQPSLRVLTTTLYHPHSWPSVDLWSSLPCLPEFASQLTSGHLLSCSACHFGLLKFPMSLGYWAVYLLLKVSLVWGFLSPTFIIPVLCSLQWAEVLRVCKLPMVHGYYDMSLLRKILQRKIKHTCFYHHPW